jgi:DNA polymerase III delta subunit
MTIETILSDIKKRAFKPIYFLHGEERFTGERSIKRSRKRL